MVQVAVGGQQVHRAQLLVLKITVYGLLLLVIQCPTVNDDTLSTVVAYHIAVLAEGIYLESLNINHILISLS
jgi:hypothetical protein